MPHNYLERKGVRVTLIGLLWGQLALSVCYGLAVMGMMAANPQPLVYENAPVTDPELAMLFAIFGLAALGVLLYIPSVVLFCMWIYRANSNARALGARDMAISPGWSVGWFFIPFANWVMPFRAMSEIARASDPRVTDGRWHLGLLPGIIPMWWGAWLISGFMAQISWRLDGTPALTSAGMWMDGFGSLVSAGAAWLAILVVQRVSSDQAVKARQTPLASQRACLDCGYDLRGTTGTHCPECGQPIAGRDDFIVYPSDQQPPSPYQTF